MTTAIQSMVLDRLMADSEWQATERSAEIGDCFVWTGVRVHNGYGRVRLAGRLTRVHRAAWIERNGPIPPETPFVLHRCDNPPCWREDHLFLGTSADNAADRDAKGRQWNQQKTSCPAGHEYDVGNTYVDKRGRRSCRRCHRESRRTSATSPRRTP